MFDNEYKEVFNRNIHASNITMFFNSHELLLNGLSQIEDQRIATYGLAQFFIISILFKILKNHQRTKIIIDTPNEYIRNISQYNNFFNTTLSTLIMIFNHFIREEKLHEDFIYKNFFKSKEQCEELSNKIITMFDTTLSISNKTYDDLCNNASIN